MSHQTDDTRRDFDHILSFRVDRRGFDQPRAVTGVEAVVAPSAWPSRLFTGTIRFPTPSGGQTVKTLSVAIFTVVTLTMFTAPSAQAQSGYRPTSFGWNSFWSPLVLPATSSAGPAVAPWSNPSRSCPNGRCASPVPQVTPYTSGYRGLRSTPDIRWSPNVSYRQSPSLTPAYSPGRCPSPAVLTPSPEHMRQRPGFRDGSSIPSQPFDGRVRFDRSQEPYYDSY